MSRRKTKPRVQSDMAYITKDKAREIGKRLAKKFGWDYDPFKAKRGRKKVAPMSSVAPLTDFDELGD